MLTNSKQSTSTTYADALQGKWVSVCLDRQQVYQYEASLVSQATLGNQQPTEKRNTMFRKEMN